MSADNNINCKSEHQEIWALLPWFVNQSLSTAEQIRVENHIKTCITCRIELKQQQQVYEKIQKTDLLQQMSEVSFHQLKKRIAVQPIAQLAPARNRLDQLQKFLFPLPYGTKYVALAAGVLLLTITVIFNASFEQTELGNEYRTLAKSVESYEKQNSLNSIHVIFTDEIDSAQIETVIHSVSGDIVNGPYKNGVYEVRIGNKQTRKEEIIDALIQLRNNPSVIFAELAHDSLSHD